LLANGFAAKFGRQQGVQPVRQGLARLAILEPAIELLPEFVGEAGDLSFARLGHGWAFRSDVVGCTRMWSDHISVRIFSLGPLAQQPPLWGLGGVLTAF